MSLTRMKAFQMLQEHANALAKVTISDLQKNTEFAQENFCVSTTNVELDFHNQRLNRNILRLLQLLFEQCQGSEKIKAMFAGEKINVTEDKPALHVALRLPEDAVFNLNGSNILDEVNLARNKIKDYANKIRNGIWTGYTGKAITDVVNIGIGGSQLGPMFCLNALDNYKIKSINFHFIGEMDPFLFHKVTSRLNPETTLFIISSKSFTTAETVHNTKQALQFINQPLYVDKHFIAITANINEAKNAGFDNIIPIWDWVGGRYSATSGINLITAIAIGYENFKKFLHGAYLMDQHFKTADATSNLPVLLALIGIWNINFLNINNHAILTYCNLLEYFAGFVQQLDMESNGKSVDINGKEVDYQTSAIVWGGSGNHAQHSYYQLLCQGRAKFTGDLISISSLDNLPINKMCYAHLEVLAKGALSDDPFANVTGNNPVNHIKLKALTPEAVGELIALYEHKTYIQGCIWNVNSFDQPGVESSKRILRRQVKETKMTEEV